jgi:secondary thiamine-phosphate synthase enzyme
MVSKSLDIKTHQRDQMLDITERVQNVVSESGVQAGIATVFVPHTTAAVTINENADPDVVHDVLAALEVCVPSRQDFFQHSEGNSAAHTKSSLVGCSISVPIIDGRLALGTWQAVYFCEFDGPRSRKFTVIIAGE